MKAGSLKDRVTLLRPPDDDATNDIGQPSTEFQKVREVWADVRIVSGREMLKAGVEISQQIFTILIRPTQIANTWRIKIETGPLKGAVVNIDSIQPTRKDVLITGSNHDRSGVDTTTRV